MNRFLQRNFTTFAAGSLVVSMAAGWMCLDYIQNQQKEKHAALQKPASILDDNSSRVKSREEMRLKAMVENALKSNWKDNLENAFQAHERFMLPGRDHGKDPKFLRKIDKRVDQLMKQQDVREGETVNKEESESIQQGAPEEKIQFWK